MNEVAFGKRCALRAMKLRRGANGIVRCSLVLHLLEIGYFVYEHYGAADQDLGATCIKTSTRHSAEVQKIYTVAAFYGQKGLNNS